MKQVPNYPRYYASESGHVHRLLLSGKYRRLRGVPDHSGYLRVWLANESGLRRVFVHHVILETFVGPRPEGQQTRHLNRKRADNRLSNLAWGTREQNTADTRGSRHRPLGSIRRKKIVMFASWGWSQTKIATKMKLDRRAVARVLAKLTHPQE